MVKKYQIFISATYEDLKEERKKVQDAILSMSQFPAGMEMFSASNEEPWEIIREAIDNSDFYVLIIGHKYGSVIEDGEYVGISYTQREYYYALREKKIPIFAFLIDRNASLTADKMEQEIVKREKLEEFKKEIISRHHVEWWLNKDDLATKVILALSKEINKVKKSGRVNEQCVEKDEAERKIIRLDLTEKEVDENKQEPQKEIESRHCMEWQMDKDDLATEESFALSKEINKVKKLECLGEQCVEKDEPESEIIYLNQQGKELNENKQESQKETVELDDKNIELERTKIIKILFIGIIGITVVLIIFQGFWGTSRDKEVMLANENVELNKDNVQESQNIELNKDNQKDEGVEVNRDNKKKDDNMGGEIQSLEENNKNSEIINWEWEYEGEANTMRRFLKNTPSELGIDVSKYQENIDWEKVKADGIDFAIIRVGSRGYESGNLYLDSRFKENMDGAIANGMKTGVYFYSQATNQDEMDEEINEILRAIEGYSLDYPVGIELVCDEDNYRTHELSTTEHQEEYIDLIKYFCIRIEQSGYTPMIFGTLEWFQQFPADAFDGYYKWIYSSDSAPNDIDNCVIWQYRNDTVGIVDGIDDKVQVSINLSVYNVKND